DPRPLRPRPARPAGGRRGHRPPPPGGTRDPGVAPLGRGRARVGRGAHGRGGEGRGRRARPPHAPRQRGGAAGAAGGARPGVAERGDHRLGGSGAGGARLRRRGEGGGAGGRGSALAAGLGGAHRLHPRPCAQRCHRRPAGTPALPAGAGGRPGSPLGARLVGVAARRGRPGRSPGIAAPGVRGGGADGARSGGGAPM
ncbi:MAG: hypothetical protein AVDCRST_MAG68-5177, partial [uncultured Gemmatimonadetes bacterium]